MQLVKLITRKKTNSLCAIRLAWLVLFCFVFSGINAQDNSPYSRFGIGDLVPNTHINSRGMGGIAAGYTDFLSINFNNPASYSTFQSITEPKSKKQVSGRAILDLGINFESRTLQEPGTTAKKFIASNALFSYVQIGVPLKKNWGISFGLRPVSRISYKIVQNEILKDQQTGLPIDSATTRYQGTGGSYLASAGTGFSLFKRERANGMEEKLSVGINGGYLFGEKDYSTRRSILNDTVTYYQANFETKANFGSLYFNAGIQYKIPVNTEKRMTLTLGAYGNWQQKLNTTKDVLRETFYYDAAQGNLRLDSVSDQRNIKDKTIYPSSVTVGFVLDKLAVPGKESGWLIGVDLATQKWETYRFYGQKDSVRNKWEVRVGAQLNPVPKRNYLSNISYRVGFFAGPDYVKVNQQLSQYGVSLGMGLPLFNYRSSYSSGNQATLINIALEYSKRGNNNNLLKENMFRLSVGFSLSDLWFGKKKYD